MKLLFALLVLLLAQVFCHEAQHEFLGSNTYRFNRGYSSPWGRWGKGVWGKSAWGNPIYGGAGRSYGGLYGSQATWKHNEESESQE